MTLEYRFRHADGEYRWTRDSVRLARGPDGTPLEIVGSWIDISAEKQAEAALRESEETWRVILNATSASLFLMDADGTVLAANDMTAQRLGKKLEQILGKSIYQFFPEEIARSRKIQVDKVFLTGEALHYEDAREGIWFENHIYPILDEVGQAARVVVSARDVTDRKRMEQSLADAKDELEGRVA